MALGVAWGVALSMAGGVVGGVIWGVALNVAWGIALGVAWGVAGGVVWGVAMSVAWGVAWRVVEGVVEDVALGMALAVAWGMACGVAVDVTVGAATMLSFVYTWVGGVSVPLGILGLVANYLGARDAPPDQVPVRYRRAMRWVPELSALPMPLLDRWLLLLAEADREAGLREIAYIAHDTRQTWAARAALVELARRDLLRLETLDGIGRAAEQLAWLPEDAPGLLGEAAEALRRAESVSREVAAALRPVSRGEREEHYGAARKGLDDLRKFAALSRQTVPLIEVADAWQQVLERQADLSRRLPNPFVFGPPLKAGSPLFVGREDILRQIAEHLAAGRGTVAEEQPKTALLLYGQRRMGKSSILYQLAVRLPAENVVAYADLHASPAQSTAGLLRELAKVVAAGLEGRGLVPPPVPPFEAFAPEPFATLNEFLDAVERVIGPRRIALLLDEFEYLQERVDEGKVSRDIFTYLNSAIKQRRGLFLVFAGLHELEQLRADYWLPFLSGNTRAIRVSYRAEAEAGRLLEMATTDLSAAVRQCILQATGCQPYLLQLVAFRLVEAFNRRTPPAEQATVGDVDEVLDAILAGSDLDWYCDDYVWRHSTPAECQALVSLARGGRDGLDPAALESLQRREILERGPDGWRYRVEMVRRWVALRAAPEAQSRPEPAVAA
jgi:hypothetical protein